MSDGDNNNKNEQTPTKEDKEVNNEDKNKTVRNLINDKLL